MADDFATLGKKLDALSKGLSGQRQRQVTQRVALLAKKDALEAAARDVGPDLAMSNWKRAKLTARFNVTSDNTAEILPKPSGPWKVITEGAKAHVVSAKHAKITGKGAVAKRRARAAAIASGARGAYSGTKPLRTPYGPRYSVRIPKTRGKQTWDKAAKKIADESPKRVNAEVLKLMKEIF